MYRPQDVGSLHGPREAISPDARAAMSGQELLDTLSELIGACETEALRFHAYADVVDSVDLCCLCTRRAVECLQAAHDLEAELQRLGGDAAPQPEEQRGWTAIRGALSQYRDHGLSCEGADNHDAALGCYRRALGRDLPPDVRQVLERQSRRLQGTHDQMLQACEHMRGARMS